MATVPGGGRLIAVKGAPDVLLDRCRDVAGADGARPLDAALRAEVDAALERSADRGQRVLAVASRRTDGPAPTEAGAIADELHDLTLEARSPSSTPLGRVSAARSRCATTPASVSR